jgi:phage shock protein A
MHRMLKTVLTLVTSRAAGVAQEAADRNALALVDHDLRRARSALQVSRRALGLAVAQGRAERRRADAAARAIADLEDRALAALSAGRDDLARRAAVAIAALSAEHAAAEDAAGALEDAAGELRRGMAEAAGRLSALDRERRVAAVAEAGLSARAAAEGLVAGDGPIPAAQELLERLRLRQDARGIACDAIVTAEPLGEAAALGASLAAEGFGPPPPNSADTVLARLKARLATSPALIKPLPSHDGDQP